MRGQIFSRDDVDDALISTNGYRGMGEMYIGEEFFDSSFSTVVGMIDGAGEYITVFYKLGD